MRERARTDVLARTVLAGLELDVESDQIILARDDHDRAGVPRVEQALELEVGCASRQGQSRHAMK